MRMKSQSAFPLVTTWRQRRPRAASVPGLIRIQASALAAVEENVGSTTTSRAPRSAASIRKCIVRDARLRRVCPDQKDEAAVGPVFGLVLGVLHAEGDWHAHRQVAVEIEAGAVRHPEGGASAVVSAFLDVTRAGHLAEHVDAVPAPLLADALEFVRDAVQYFLPARLAETAGAALAVAHQRLEDAVGPVDEQVVGDSLHAAAGVVGGLRVVGRLLHLHHVAVPHERKLPAGAGAVRRASGAHHSVDRQRMLVLDAAGGQRLAGRAEGGAASLRWRGAGRLDELPARELQATVYSVRSSSERGGCPRPPGAVASGPDGSGTASRSRPLDRRARGAGAAELPSRTLASRHSRSNRGAVSIERKVSSAPQGQSAVRRWASGREPASRFRPRSATLAPASRCTSGSDPAARMNPAWYPRTYLLGDAGRRSRCPMPVRALQMVVI